MARKRVTWVDRPDIYHRGFKCYGLADLETYTIEIDPGLSLRKTLVVEVHELLHLAFPEARERQVDRIAKFIGGELWRRGWRR